MKRKLDESTKTHCIAMNKNGVRCSRNRSTKQGTDPLFCLGHNKRTPTNLVDATQCESINIREDDDGHWVDDNGNIYNINTHVKIGIKDLTNGQKKFF